MHSIVHLGLFYGFFFDPWFWVFTGPTLLLSLYAQFKVKSTFGHYAKVGVRSRMTGAQAAAAVMRAGGVEGVTIERHQGFLSDHYDPRKKALRLSPDVYDGQSVSALAVAAHEAGHSIQDATAYGPLVLRSKLVPVTQIGASLWMWPFLAGMVFNTVSLIYVGIALFAGIVLFQLVTLPTEFDASNRAKAVLAETGIVSTQEEAVGVSKVLNAAALTYVAAALAAIGQLLYLLMIASGRSRD